MKFGDLVVSCKLRHDPSFTYVGHNAKKDETLTNIATRLNLSDYMILEKNSKNISDYDDVDEN
jgi:hypothetical protein